MTLHETAKQAGMPKKSSLIRNYTQLLWIAQLFIIPGSGHKHCLTTQQFCGFCFSVTTQPAGKLCSDMLSVLFTRTWREDKRPIKSHPEACSARISSANNLQQYSAAKTNRATFASTFRPLAREQTDSKCQGVHSWADSLESPSYSHQCPEIALWNGHIDQRQVSGGSGAFSPRLSALWQILSQTL